MITQELAPPARLPDLVMTFEVGSGGLVKFIDLIPEPPGRIRYRDGSLTVVSPSPPYERELLRIDDIVVTICEELEIESSPAGSVLFRRDDLERGVMPDRAYYFEHIGALNEVTETVDLRRYPPPDLVLEVVWSHGPKEALEILSELKVPEVWVYEIPEERLQFLQLDEDGSYVPQARSLSLPFLEPEDVLGQLRSAVQGEPYFRWKRRLRDWVRGTLAPRRTEGK